jgi:hypothetical protein
VSRRLVVTAAVAVILSACGPSPMPSQTATLTASTSPRPTVQPTVESQAAPSPSSVTYLSDEELADVSIEVERPTAVCDQDPSNAYAGGPDSQITCYDGLQLGLRALRTRMTSVDRLYLHRGACAGVRCTPIELDTVAVIGWLSGDAYTVTITWETHEITAPADGAIADWPTASGSVPPQVERPTIAAAPAEIRQREPYPYCGREEPVGLITDEPGDFEHVLEINRCFFDGVLEGRPVEMVKTTDVAIEPVVLRFDGQGFVTRYMKYDTPRTWHRDQGPVILGTSVFFGLENSAAGVEIHG